MSAQSSFATNIVVHYNNIYKECDGQRLGLSDRERRYGVDR